MLLTGNGIVTNKTFLKFIKPFLTNQSCNKQNKIMLIKDDKVLSEKKEAFNKHYVNIVENSSGIKPYKVTLKISIAKIKQKTGKKLLSLAL